MKTCVRNPAAIVKAERVSVVVTFVGGPCDGSFEVGSGKTDHHFAAALAYEKYRTNTPGIGCGFWAGICAGDQHAENYRIVEAKETLTARLSWCASTTVD